MRNVYKCSRDTCASIRYDDEEDDDNDGNKQRVRHRRLLDTSPMNEGCLLLSNFTSPQCNAYDFLCLEGSEGPLCGACKEGWVYKSQDRTCSPCLASSLTWFEVYETTQVHTRTQVSVCSFFFCF